MRSVLSIRDLIAEIVRFMWLIIICALFGAVLLGGVKYVKDLSASKQQTVEEVVLEDTFTTEEINQISNYVALKNRYLNFVEHVYSVPVLQLNAHNVDTVSLQYLVSAHDVNDKNDIVTSYHAYINNGNLAQDIADKVGMSASDVQVLICHVSKEAYYAQSDMAGVIELKIWGRTLDESVEIANAIKEQLASHGKMLMNNDLVHDLELIDERILKIFDNDLYAEQVAYTSNVEKEYNYMKNQEGSMTAEQLAAADEFFVTDEVKEEAEQEAQDKKVTISKKYIVLGAVLGGVGAVGLVLAWYILTATIKFAEEIRMVYGVRYLGQLTFKNKNKFEGLADKLLYASKLQPFETQKELLYSKILMTCECENVKEFVLTGEFGNNQEYAQEFQKKMADNGITVKVVGDILSQPEALKELKGEKNVVFVETIKRSKYENVHQKIVLCDEQNIKMLGYIIFE